MASVQHSDLAARYARMGTLELREVIGAPTGTYTAEALAAANAELASRPASEPVVPREEVEEERERVSNQSGLRAVVGVILMLLSCVFLAPAILNLLFLPFDPAVPVALVSVVAIVIGLLLLFGARKLDQRFWSHVPKAFGISGFGQAGIATAQMASAGALSLDHAQRVLEGLVTCTVAVVFWFVGRRR